MAGTPVHAQNVAPPAVDVGHDEIVVSARKRAESILKVPVVVSAISQDRIEALGVTEVRDLPKLVPGVNLGNALLSIGTFVSIRGVGQTTQDPGVDQSVSLNIDGLSLGNGLAFSSGLFDVGQIEVFKGPQALFYGKSSPAGVIAIRTADPTDETEVILRAGYEFEARNPTGELIVSGPVADTLKLRVAGKYSRSKGFFYNRAVAQPGGGAVVPPHSRLPRSESWVLRGTALWEPTSDLTVRFKINAVHDWAILGENFQYASCPEGPGAVPGVDIPFLGGGEDCRLDRISRTVALDPVAFPAALNDGLPFLETDQQYGTLNLDYKLSDSLTLSSTTAYYRLKSKSSVNAAETTFSGPPIGVNNHFRRRQFTQELRLDSNYSGPLNFMLGAFFEDGYVRDHIAVLGNGARGAPPILQDGIHNLNIKTYSAFGQGRWQIVPELELAAGVRYTDEKRSDDPFDVLNNRPTIIPVPVIRSKNWAPEATLTYTPTDNLTLFAAYKKGYKSGSFSIATPAVAGRDNSFGDETVEGGEAGLKARVMDRQLSLNLAGYYYKYADLQQGVRTPPEGGLPRVQTVNAAGAEVYGVDFDASYRPDAVPGLSVNAAVLWNHADYTTFTNAPCYGGQLVTDGCNQLFNPLVNAFTAQDLSGTPLVRAPRWTITAGFDYEMPVGDGYRLLFSNSNSYTSEYVTTQAANRPGRDNYQPGFAKIDLGLTLKAPDDRWEIAAIGKNITNKIVAGTCNISSYATGTTITNPSGGTTRGPGGFDEVGCFAQPGREVLLRLTFRP
jgi:iron complex outermembrane receptor protein